MSHPDTLSDDQVADMRDHFYRLGWGRNETMWKCWNQALDYLAPQLSAMTQRAEAAEAECAMLQVQLKGEREECDKLLEAAEARIKASQEQEPVKENEIYPVGTKFYAAPVIPPDVAELQRELRCAQEDNEILEGENAELTRKLEESEKARKQYFMEMCDVIEKNDKLLAEAKIKAVPEGWQLVPRYPTEKMHRKGAEYKNATSIYKAMLAAAPQPGGSNE